MLEVTAVAVGTFQDFSSVLSSASDFDSAEALRSSVTVEAMFAVLWFGMIMLLGAAQIRSRYCVDGEAALSKDHRDNHIVAVTKSSDARVAVSGASEVVASTADEAQRSIREYVLNLFPHIFSGESRVSRLQFELMVSFESSVYVAILLFLSRHNMNSFSAC